MRASWNIGRVAGIDLFLHPTFLLLLAFVGLTNSDSLGAVLLISAVFGCVLLHELGHALMARWYGIETADITLYPIGGVARLERMPKAPGAELLIALAGPAVNVALALLFGGMMAIRSFWSLSVSEGPGVMLLSNLLIINLGLALFNMVPAFPMDGGRVLRALLSGWLGRRRATEIASMIGRGLALAFGMYSLLHGDLIRATLAGFIYMAARAELAQVHDEQGNGRRPPPPDDSSRHDAPDGYTWIRRDQGVWQLCPIPVSSHRTGRRWN